MKPGTVPAGLAIGFMLAAMLMAAGCTEVTEDTCGVLSGKDRDHCYQNIAKISGNLDLCNKIEGAGPASKCYVYVAKTNTHIGVCGAMRDQQWYNLTSPLSIVSTNICA